MKSAFVMVLTLIPAALAAQAQPDPIQDNSFLMEEAYNQEAGVVQHISVFTHDLKASPWAYAFTQEWPLGGQRFQFSYTLPLVNDGASTSVTEFAAHLRYQLVGNGETRVAVAPRLTFIKPLGSVRRSSVEGPSFQLGIPLSVVLSPRLVAHTNAGLTITPSAHDGVTGDGAFTKGVSFGQSLIALVTPTLNFMVEAAWSRSEAVSGPDATVASSSLVVSPGIRYAFNFASGLQIVPGVAVPIGVGPSSGESSLLVYLSFEHAFRR